MNAHTRIPATIVTGFLGAGKTTLIRNLIEKARGRRIAILVNEFGEAGFDGELLADCGDADCKPDTIVELANGCICCTVADEFLPTMEALLARDPAPDHIVIETSGLALPQPLVRAFSWPSVKHRVTVDGVVTVVDAAAVAAGRFAPDPEATKAALAADPAIDHDDPIEELFEDQLRCADLIVVSKSDLVSENELVEAEAAARKADAVDHGQSLPWPPNAPRPGVGPVVVATATEGRHKLVALCLKEPPRWHLHCCPRCTVTGYTTTWAASCRVRRPRWAICSRCGPQHVGSPEAAAHARFLRARDAQLHQTPWAAVGQ